MKNAKILYVLIGISVGVVAFLSIPRVLIYGEDDAEEAAEEEEAEEEEAAEEELPSAAGNGEQCSAGQVLSDSGCEPAEVQKIVGCMNEFANNYNEDAVEDDGTCEYPGGDYRCQYGGCPKDRPDCDTSKGDWIGTKMYDGLCQGNKWNFWTKEQGEDAAKCIIRTKIGLDRLKHKENNTVTEKKRGDSC